MHSAMLTHGDQKEGHDGLNLDGIVEEHDDADQSNLTSHNNDFPEVPLLDVIACRQQTTWS